MQQVQLKVSGLPTILHETGCQLPCHRYTYKTEIAFRASQKKIYPNGYKYPFGDPKGKTTIIVTIQKTDRLDFIDEKIKYTVNDLISDVGGTCGLILGLSIYELFNSSVLLINWAKR